MSQLAGRITRAAWFQRFVIATILLAGVLAGVETDAGMVAAHGPLLRWLDGLVLAIFSAEILLKMAAAWPQPWRFFRDGWNVFDFLVVALCLLPLHSHFAFVLRLGRALRLLRLASALPKLQLLVGALLKSFSSMGYVGLLLGLMLYVYGIMGVHFFGHGAPESFGTLAAALLTLFQIITLDDWRALYDAAVAAAPAAAPTYFISFILLGTMIMLNLFIGVIMNSMEEMHAEQDEGKRAKAGQDGTEAGAEGELAADLAALGKQLAAVQARLESLAARENLTSSSRG